MVISGAILGESKAFNSLVDSLEVRLPLISLLLKSIVTSGIQ